MLAKGLLGFLVKDRSLNWLQFMVSSENPSEDPFEQTKSIYARQGGPNEVITVLV